MDVSQSLSIIIFKFFIQTILSCGWRMEVRPCINPPEAGPTLDPSGTEIIELDRDGPVRHRDDIDGKRQNRMDTD